MKTLEPVRGALLIGALAAALGAADASAQGIEPYRISATRKTESQRKGDARRMPFRDAKMRPTSTDIYYSLELRRMTPDSPENVTVEALIVLQAPSGRVFPGGYSREAIQLPLGIATTLETDSVALESVEWRGRFGADGTFGTELLGYAVRVLDAEGKVLASRVLPKNLEKDVESLIEEWNRALNAPAAPGGGAAPGMPPGPRPRPVPPPWRR